MHMSTVLVTGGTGHLGSSVVRLLKQREHDVRVLARSPGGDPGIQWVRGDLATGEGIAEAVAGVDSLVHAATSSPMAQRGYPLPGDFVRTPADVDVDGTSRLVEAAAKAGVGHVVHVSIVGLQQAPLPYAKVKIAAEEVVRASAAPWSIVRASAFHWLLDRMLGRMRPLPAWTLPKFRAQPVDSDDFAEYVVERLLAGPAGECADFTGPETLTLDELARQYLRATGLHRPVVAVPVPERFAEVLGGLAGPDARHGRTTWSEWLDLHHGEAGAA
jgi:uncharacterized protein YbjT (DUF2867 family)